MAADFTWPGQSALFWLEKFAGARERSAMQLGNINQSVVISSTRAMLLRPNLFSHSLFCHFLCKIYIFLIVSNIFANAVTNKVKFIMRVHFSEKSLFQQELDFAQPYNLNC